MHHELSLIKMKTRIQLVIFVYLLNNSNLRRLIGLFDAKWMQNDATRLLIPSRFLWQMKFPSTFFYNIERHLSGKFFTFWNCNFLLFFFFLVQANKAVCLFLSQKLCSVFFRLVPQLHFICNKSICPILFLTTNTMSQTAPFFFTFLFHFFVMSVFRNYT